MNLLFTNYCNLKCPYCFAAQKLNYDATKKDLYISFANLKIALDYFKKTKQKFLHILGGEPTLHPRFKEALTMILDAGVDVLIFSNGLISEKNLLFLKKTDKERCSVAININSPTSYRPKEWSTVNKSLKILSEKIQLSFNIYEENFDANFMLRLIGTYNLKRKIRIGLASPIVGQNNQYLPLEGHRKVAGQILNFAAECHRRAVTLGYDCGFRLCSFTEKERKLLAHYGSPLASYCLPVVDIGPDLSVWNCFATSRFSNRRLTDFNNLEEIENFFYRKLLVFRRVGSSEKCIKCEYLKNKQCCGGCLGHTLKSFGLEMKPMPVLK